MTPADVLVVWHEPDTGPGWFAPWLSEAGLRLVDCHPYRGEALPDITRYDGVVVLGGAMAPGDDDTCPWLPDTRDLLAAAVQQSVPTFGICLGGELLAMACGGQCRRGRNGPELGVVPFRLREEARSDAVFGGWDTTAAEPLVLQWHWEEIATLPPGATLLASSDAYPHQVFRVGKTAWGVQGHPEVTAEIAAAWAREDSPLLREAGRDPEGLVAELSAAQPALAALWRPVAARFAGVVGARARARS